MFNCYFSLVVSLLIYSLPAKDLVNIDSTILFLHYNMGAFCYFSLFYITQNLTNLFGELSGESFWHFNRNLFQFILLTLFREFLNKKLVKTALSVLWFIYHYMCIQLIFPICYLERFSAASFAIMSLMSYSLPVLVSNFFCHFDFLSLLMAIQQSGCDYFMHVYHFFCYLSTALVRWVLRVVLFLRILKK